MTRDHSISGSDAVRDPSASAGAPRPASSPKGSSTPVRHARSEPTSRREAADGVVAGFASVRAAVEAASASLAPDDPLFAMADWANDLHGEAIAAARWEAPEPETAVSIQKQLSAWIDQVAVRMAVDHLERGGTGDPIPRPRRGDFETDRGFLEAVTVWSRARRAAAEAAESATDAENGHGETSQAGGGDDPALDRWLGHIASRMAELHARDLGPTAVAGSPPSQPQGADEAETGSRGIVGGEAIPGEAPADCDELLSEGLAGWLADYSWGWGRRVVHETAAADRLGRALDAILAGDDDSAPAVAARALVKIVTGDARLVADLAPIAHRIVDWGLLARRYRGVGGSEGPIAVSRRRHRPRRRAGSPLPSRDRGETTGDYLSRTARELERGDRVHD